MNLISAPFSRHFRTAKLLAAGLFMLLAACGTATPTINPVPIPDVPPIEEIDAAIALWSSGNNGDYFVEVEEVTLDGSTLNRIVVANGVVRAAQRLARADGAWQPPTALALEDAENYTVDALLARIRRDALGEGPAPMDMLAIFDPLSGFPSVVETTALPTFTADGLLSQNRDLSYTMGIKLDILIEDTIGLGKDVLLVLTRSGGDQAWCDNLRIFTDGSSVYADDCRQTLLQLRPPADDLAILEALAAEHSNVDTVMELEGAQIHLIINGTGSVAASSETLDNLWGQATGLADLLSKPIGAGVTLLYQEASALFGFDMRTLLAQPASLDWTPPLYAVIAAPDSSFLAFADGQALRHFDVSSGDLGRFFSNPEGGQYTLRGWGSLGHVILQRGSGDDLEWGWTHLDDTSWMPIAIKQGFACDTGVSISPDSPEIVIGSGGPECESDLGLTLIHLEDGGQRQLVDLTISVGDQTVGRGAHHPAWSPDGSWIAVVLDSDGASQDSLPGQLHLIRPDGGEIKILTENTGGRASYPVWSPDGQRLYYALDGAETGDDGIYEYLLATGEHSLLIDGSDLVPRSISPTDEFLAFDTPDSLSIWIFTHNSIFPVSQVTDGNRPVFSGWLLAREG
jgi:hypothetical protein